MLHLTSMGSTVYLSIWEDQGPPAHHQTSLLGRRPRGYLRLASGQLPPLRGFFVQLKWKCFPACFGPLCRRPGGPGFCFLSDTLPCGLLQMNPLEDREVRVLKMSAADPEIHSWVNRAGGDVFISGFMVTLTYVMGLRWGVGPEKRPKGLPSISGPAKTKASGTLGFWGAASILGRALTIWGNCSPSHYVFIQMFPSQ